MIYKRAAVIGIGLIGGSFALAAKRAGVVGSVVGVARTAATREAALTMGAVDEVSDDSAEAVRGADLVYIAVPVGATRSIFKQIGTALEPGTLVTDVGSTKQEVMAEATELLPETVTFIGGHPMAGSEQSGIRAARDNLFEETVYFLTPVSGTVELEEPSTERGALCRLPELVSALGARPVVTTPEYHDRQVAATSHLPHLVSAALVRAVEVLSGEGDDTADFVGNGFRDTTRLAAGSPEIWRDIFLTNDQNVAAALEEIIRQLEQFAVAFSSKDPGSFEALLQQARRARGELLE